jgi:hypothetical protein
VQLRDSVTKSGLYEHQWEINLRACREELGSGMDSGWLRAKGCLLNLVLSIACFVLGGAIRAKQWASSHHHSCVRESRRILTIIPRKETLQYTSVVMMIVRLPWHQHQPWALSLQLVLRYYNSDSKWYQNLATENLYYAYALNISLHISRCEAQIAVS